MKDRLSNLLLILSICYVSARKYSKNEIESCLEEAEAATRNYVPPKDYGFQANGTKISPHISCDYVIVGASDCGIVTAVKLRQALLNAKICLINAGSITLNSTCLTKVPGFKKYLSLVSRASMGLQSAPSTNYFLGYKGGKIRISSSKLGGGFSAINSMTFGKPTFSEMTTFREIVEKFEEEESSEENSGLLGGLLGGVLGGVLGGLLGGSSSLSAEDILHWVLGLKEDMKILERSLIPNADLSCHGIQGLFPTSFNKYVGKATEEFIKNGGDQIDYNCDEGVGCSNIQVTISNSGRYTSVDAFLQHSDITIISNAFVTEINIAQTDSDCCRFAATGIKYVQKNILFSLDVTNEVILSAGVINTAKILQNSGIGDCEELERFNIPCQKHLPDVGQSQRARPKIRLLLKTNCTENTCITNEVIEEYIQYGTGLLSNAGNLGGICFLHTKNPNSPHPNFQFKINYVNCSDEVFLKTLNLKDDIANEWCNNLKYPDGALMITITPINYKSTVSTTLKSSKIFDFPKIEYNFAQEDQNKLAEAITYLKNNIGRFFKECSTELDVQIPSIEDPNKSEFENNLNFVKYTASFSSRITGGCDIGKVIDSKMKVIDSCNLRVCDSCALPISPSRNPSSLLMAMGSTLVDFIIQN